MSKGRAMRIAATIAVALASSIIAVHAQSPQEIVDLVLKRIA